MPQAVAILMLTKSSSDTDTAVKRIAVSYPPICEDLIVQLQASFALLVARRAAACLLRHIQGIAAHRNPLHQRWLAGASCDGQGLP